jgi:hypothetical protein
VAPPIVRAPCIQPQVRITYGVSAHVPVAMASVRSRPLPQPRGAERSSVRVRVLRGPRRAWHHGYPSCAPVRCAVRRGRTRAPDARRYCPAWHSSRDRPRGPC